MHQHVWGLGQVEQQLQLPQLLFPVSQRLAAGGHVAVDG